MKKIISLCLALAFFAMAALAEDVTRKVTFTSAKVDDAIITVAGTGAYTHTLTWTGAGTRTTCTIKLSSSPDATTWSDLIADQDCTTDGSASTTGYTNFIRIEVTALTGSGNTVYARYDGTSSISGSAVNQGSPNAGGANAWPVSVAGLTTDPAESASATTTNPAIVGGQAVAALKTAVHDGDASRLVTDLYGNLVIYPFAVPQLQGSAYTATPLNGATGQELVAADATYKICVTSIMLYNADTTNSEAVSLLEGGQIGVGTVIATLPAPANGGVAIAFPTPLCTSAVNKSIAADSAGSANPVSVTITYFKRVL